MRKMLKSRNTGATVGFYKRQAEGFADPETCISSCLATLAQRLKKLPVPLGEKESKRPLLKLKLVSEESCAQDLEMATLSPPAVPRPRGRARTLFLLMLGADQQVRQKRFTSSGRGLPIYREVGPHGEGRSVTSVHAAQLRALASDPCRVLLWPRGVSMKAS